LQALKQQKLEMEVWQDLASIYVDLCSFLDAKVCVDKAQLIDFFSPRSWHITGMEQVSLLNCSIFLHFFIYQSEITCM